MMTREEAFEHIEYCLDDSLNVRRMSEMPDPDTKVRLVVWDPVADRPMVVAVWSYLNVRLSADEAEEIAINYLDEIGKTMNGTPDYVL